LQKVPVWNILVSMKEKLLYSWKTEGFEHYEKEIAWYVNTAILFLAIASLFIFILHLYLAAAVVIVGLAAVYVHANQEPQRIECRITNRRIKIGNRDYPFQKLKSFWILDQSSRPKFYLQTTALLFSTLSVPLGEGEATEIRKTLKNLLPEFGRGEAISDRITRWLRF